MRKSIILVVLALCGITAVTAAPTAVISLVPGTTVRAGAEVTVEGIRSTVSTGIHDARFYWDFGDGYTADHGLAMSHYYINPGTYTITLDLMDADSSRDTATTVITVTGDTPLMAPRAATDPLIWLDMEGDLDDASPSARDGAWQNGTGAFGYGASGTGAELNGAYVTAADAGGELAGTDELTVSVWAKFGDLTSGDRMYLCHKSGAFQMWVNAKAWNIYGAVTTVNGNVGGSQWLSALGDALWHQYTMRWDGSELTFYVDGVLKKTTTGSGAVAASSSPLEVGAYNGGSLFNGSIDDVKVYGSALTYAEMSRRFELWHADFESRTAQYVTALIPPAVAADASNRMVATLSDGGASTTLVDKAGLTGQEKFLVEPGKLTAGTYTLTVELQEAGGTVIERIVRGFSKGYDGLPHVGIDENNAVRVDGELYFPVAPFMLGTDEVELWGGEQYINTVYGIPWYTHYGVSSWMDYINRAGRVGCMAMGPGHFAGKGTNKDFYKHRNADTDSIRQFVETTRDSAGMLFWIWDDEPDLGGEDQYLPAQTIRAWSRISRDNDGQHPVATNLVGSPYIKGGWHFTRTAKYNFKHNAGVFGQRTLVADVYCMDYYPYNFANDGATVHQMAEILDTVKSWNNDMVPYMSFIETSNINTAAGTPPPTAAELKMLTWLNVVHGCKGMNWFQHFTETSSDNLAFMKTFVAQTTELAPVILAPETDYEVTVDDAAQGVRIDHMVRAYDDALYLFAVRLTEVTETDDPAATVTFTLPAGLNMTLAEVFDEGRSITVSGNSISDEFEANGVHIYRIPYGDNICIDLDRDGYCSSLSTPVPAQPDCDDTNATVHPGATELCDGVDNNCGGGTDEGFPNDDSDGDSYIYCVDNCPDSYNPLQADFDYDGIGDSCDTVFTWFDDFNTREPGIGGLSSHMKNNDFTWRQLMLAAGVSEGDQWLRSNFYPGGNTFVATDQSFIEYTVEMDIRHSWGGATNSAGFAFHVQDKKNYYFFCLSGAGDELFTGGGNGYGIYEVVDGTGTLVATGDMRIPHQAGSLINHYRFDVSMQGGAVQVDASFKHMYDDSATGAHQYVITNPAFQSGAIGAYSQAANHNHFWLDNIKLETADFPVYSALDDPAQIDPSGAYGLGLYPNPFSGQLYVPACVTRGMITVTSLSGRTVGSFPFANGTLVLPDNTAFEPGMHLVQIEGVPGVQRIMVVK